MQQMTVSTVALRTFELFQGLSERTLERAAQVTTMRRYERGEVVIGAGEPSDCVYFVLTGSVKAMVSNGDGRDAVLSLLGRGAIIGELAMFGAHPRSASVVAAAAADLGRISAADLRALMRESHELSWRMMCLLADRLREAGRKIESLSLRDVRSRVMEVLWQLSNPESDSQLVETRISMVDLAGMVGASREMVSRVLRELDREGLVEKTPVGWRLHDRRKP